MAEYDARAILLAAESAFRLNSRYLIATENPSPKVHAEQLLEVLLTATSCKLGFISVIDNPSAGSSASLLTSPNQASRSAGYSEFLQQLGRTSIDGSVTDHFPPSPREPERGLSALCIIPVAVGDEVVAVVGLANREAGFDGREQLLLCPILHQIALAAHFIRISDRNEEDPDGLARSALWEQSNNWYGHKSMWSSMAHDLNGAFAAVSLQIQLLLEHADPTTTRGLARVADAMGRLSYFGRNLELLATMREESSPAAPISSVLGVARFITRDMVSDPESLSFVLECDDNTVVGLPGNQLLMVVYALVSNSVEAPTSRRRQIVLTVSAVMDGFVSLSVADNCDGVRPTMLPSLFRHRVSSKGAERGTGLLAVKAAVEGHGGAVSITSRDAGTTVTVELPVVRP